MPDYELLKSWQNNQTCEEENYSQYLRVKTKLKKSTTFIIYKKSDGSLIFSYDLSFRVKA